MSREIDALIAEHVMGWAYRELHDVWIPQEIEGEILDNILADEWRPSEDIGDAWEVIEALKYLWFQVGRENCLGERYDVHCYNHPDMTDKVSAFADTAPMAICLAALKAKGISLPNHPAPESPEPQGA